MVCVLVCKYFTCPVWNKGVGACVAHSVTPNCWWQDGSEVLWSLPLAFKIKYDHLFYEKDRFEGVSECHVLIQKIFIEHLLYCIMISKLRSKLYSELFGNKLCLNPQDLHRTQDKASGYWREIMERQSGYPKCSTWWMDSYPLVCPGAVGLDSWSCSLTAVETIRSPQHAHISICRRWHERSA